MIDEQAYEVHGLRSDGSTYTVEVLDLQSQDAATALAQQYADLWCTQVKLYRVSFVHIGSAPWGEGQMHFICQVDPKPAAAGQMLPEDIVPPES
jgi:hypothetical protein